MNPTIDIVIPCYKYGKYLESCVESILCQHDVDPRILIIDDASPDDSAEVASEIARGSTNVQFHRHAVNMGHVATFNEGIDWSSSEFFLLLSADDYLLPGSLGRATRLLIENSDAGFAFGSAVIRYGEGKVVHINPLRGAALGHGTRVLTGNDFITFSGAKNIVPTPTAVVRTELQKRVGGYREDLPHCGDMEMWLRLAAQAPVGFISDYQAVYRLHDANMSLMYSGQNILRDLYQRKKAIKTVFRAAPSLPNANVLEAGLIQDLAFQAIGEASSAFNYGNLALSEELRRFALELSPNAWKSLPWAKLGFKRAIGVPNWRTLAPLWARLQLLLGSRSQ
ncbi:glycosyltransferase [Rhizobium sp. ARZ01]|uniref:glycosyltransferase family 2 protein n=1 Tax=Rhizobium sp. ARZ01 TaxID=2769313 RepID=UPI001786F823|nr:glycosyltransferase [Rhizobium sp. ARZ01]MBD9374408.1 glycosyltransferase [Rhizobium sp. ARZ01]